jgi:4-hydroxybenzoyl-CoA reductase subunit beta
MGLPEFEHFEPETLTEACSLLQRYRDGSRVIAGGTDLINLMKDRLIEPQYLIDLKKISELRSLRYDTDKGLVIGSAVTLTELIHSPLVREKALLLVKAARAVGAPPLQNMATIGGNVCLDTRCLFYNQSKYWRSSHPICFKAGGSVCLVVRNSESCHSVFQADVACALFAMNARVKLMEENGERILSLDEFYTGEGEKPNRLKSTEILTEIWIPPYDGEVVAYQKLSSRAVLDFPQVGVAAALWRDLDGRIEGAKIVLNAVTSYPFELKSAQALLEGKQLNQDLIEKIAQSAFESAHPVNNTGMFPLYRKKMVRVFVKRILEGFLLC